MKDKFLTTSSYLMLGAGLTVSTIEEIKAWLQIIGLAAGITLTVITIVYKVKNHGKDS